jgi:hypothetical protein
MRRHPAKARVPLPFEEPPVRVISVLLALAILGVGLWLIPQTRRSMLIAAETVSLSMPRMR